MGRVQVLQEGGTTTVEILDGTVVNADISASAAIAGTKIDPTFGSQTVSAVIADTDNVVAASFTQNDTTNDPNCATFITTAGSVNVLLTSANAFNNGMLQLDQTSTGDANLVFSINNGNAKSIGIDNSDGDKLKISASKAVNTNTIITLETSAITPTALIDFSNFAVDSDTLKFVADAITTVGTVSHQVAVDVGGTTFYFVAYTHGS